MFFKNTIFFILLSLFNCNTTNVEKHENLAKAELAHAQIGLSSSFYASLFHKDLFNLTSDVFTNEANVHSALLELQIANGSICEMVWGYKRFDKKLIAKFEEKLQNKNSNYPWHSHLLNRLIMGCWNFYDLNDHYADRSFSALNKLILGKKNCYTVGFMQGYMMLETMNCTRMNFIDIDWKILDSHAAILKRAREKGSINEDDLNELGLVWNVNFDSRPKKVQPIKFESICERRILKLCKSSLENYHKNLGKVDQVNFILASLEDSKFQFSDDAVPVFYVSNALDGGYMTPSKIKQFLKNIHESLKLGQKAVIIYHAGGTSAFGIYAIDKISEEKYEINIHCKDTYHYAKIYKMEGTYENYLDLIATRTSKSKANSCKLIW
ncbi:MAG: hypothetical protein SFU98_03070 [Leptospiraceae bacterium]|nr:hypothetical protein [Leptospiraceae bacterium]